MTSNLDSLLHTLLWQRRADLLELQEQWPTPLASAARYGTQAKEAIRLACLLAGVSSDATNLHWLPPITCILPTTEYLEDDEQAEDAIEPTGALLLPPEHVQLDDVLDSRGYQEDEGDEQDISDHEFTVNLEWHSPQVSDCRTAQCSAKNHIPFRSSPSTLLT